MKRTIFGLATILVVFVAVFAVLVLRPLAKVKADHHGCSDATLRGNYGLVAPGFYSNGYPDPLDFSMLANFDGKGGFRGSSVYFVVDGTRYGPDTFKDATYTVYPDCTCTFAAYLTTYSGSVTGNGIVVDTGGDELAGTLYSPPHLAGTFDAKRVGEGKQGFSD